MTHDALRELVFRALDATIENGYEVDVDNNLEAMSLLDLDAEIEESGSDINAVAELVAEWKKARHG